MIRRLGEADWEAYREVRLLALRTAPDAFATTHAAESERTEREQRARLRDSVVMAVIVDGKGVGMAALRPEDGPKERHRGFLWGVFVDPASRGRGLGRALIGRVLESAPAEVEQVTLSVLATNTAAIGLYQSLGFKPYGLHPRALRQPWGDSDELLMLLELRAPP